MFQLQKGLQKVNKDLKEELFMAKNVNSQASDIDLEEIYSRLESIHMVMHDMNRGRDIDLEMLTGSVKKRDNRGLKMIHFTKVITQMSSILCDIYAKKCSDSSECAMQ